MMKRTASVAWVLLMAGVAGAQTNEVGTGGVTSFAMENLSFEQGTSSWVCVYDTNVYVQAPATEVSDKITDGKKALQIRATNGTVEVLQEILKKSYSTNETWNLTYDLKLSDPEDIDKFCIHHDYTREKSEGLGQRPYPFLVNVKKLDNGWLRATVRIHLDGDYKKLRVGFMSDADVLIDNLRLERAAGINSDTMYYIDPYQITISRALEPQLAVEVFYNKDLIRRAQMYNWLLSDMVFAKQKTVKLNRMAFYLGLDPDQALNASMAEAEQGVAELYDIYSKAYLTPRFMHRGICPMLAPESKMILAMEFDPLAKTVRSRLTTLQAESDKHTEQLTEKARKAGRQWHTPPVVTDTPYKIRENGRPNQIIFPVWGGQGNFHVEWARAMKLGKTHTLTSEGFRNVRLPDGQTVYSELDAEMAFLKSYGYEYYVMHGPVYSLNPDLGSDFYEKNKASPDMFLKHRTSGVMSNASYYNWWQPEVRAQVDKVTRSLCAGIKDRDEVLVLATAAEVWDRDLDFSRPGIANFQEYLAKKYGAVGKLNELWKSKYTSFAEIIPDAKPYAKGSGPLQIDSSEWLDGEFVGWWKFVYDTIKKYAPKKLVMSQHNQFAYGIDPAPYFKTVDVLAHHSSMNGFLAARQAVQSMNRFEKKILGQYEPALSECFRFERRFGDERVIAAANSMDLYRKVVGGMVIMAKAYPYSTAYYAPKYIDNVWFDYILGLTILRYAAMGVGIAIDNIKALEPVFLDSDKAATRVLLIHGLTYQEGFQEVYDFLIHNDYDYECLSVSYIAQGAEKLENYDVIMMPFHQNKDEKISPYLQTYVEQGGVLICLTGSRLEDRYGRPLEGRLNAELRKIYGGAKATSKTEENVMAAYEPNAGKADVLESLDLNDNDITGFRLGKGQVFVLRSSPRQLPSKPEIRKHLLDILGSHTQRLAYSQKHSYELRLLRHSQNQNKYYLCIINPSADCAREDEVRVRGKYQQVSDINVPGGMAVPATFAEGYTAFRTRLEPGGFAVIEMDKIE